MISKSSIDKIFDTAIIEDVIGDYVRLKKRGSGFVGLSPWSNEKTPSFHVSPSKNIYKDFSTGKGGSVVSFLMEMEGFSYPEALRHLAKRYNIEIEEDVQPDPNYEEKKDLKAAILIANEFALEFYKKQLFETEEGKNIGLSYFKERGFTQDTIQKFELAYAPETWDLLDKTMRAQQFKEEVLISAGLVKKRDKGNIDFFRERVLFPIHNYIGKAVGFGGRTLKNEKSIPKYLNTAESEVYNKSKLLYGLFQAKQSIRKEDNCFLVEGYTDVIALSQAGIENVVATAGTALTLDQIRLIKRLSKNISMLYDGDAPGIKAALRGLDLCLEEDTNVNMILLPEGADPDSFVKKNGGQGFRDYVAEKGEDFLHFKAKYLQKEAGNSPSKRADVLRDMVQSISLIKDPLKRSIYIKDTAQILDIEEDLLIDASNKQRRAAQRKGLSRQEAEAERNVDPEERGTNKKIKQEGLEKSHLELLEVMEKDVIRLLIEYGPIHIEENVPVIQFVLSSIEEQGIEFKNPTYASILSDYKTAFEKDELLDPKQLIMHPDEAVRNCVVDFLHSPYEMSENWEKKHEIYHADRQTIMENDVKSSLHRFIQRNIEELLADIDLQVKEHKGTEEELMELLVYKKQLHESWAEVSKILGTVLIKK